MTLHLYCSTIMFKNAHLQEAVRLASLRKWDEADVELSHASNQDEEYSMAMTYIAGHAMKQWPVSTDVLETLLQQGLDPNACLPHIIKGRLVPLLGLAASPGNEQATLDCSQLLIDAGASPLKAQETGYPLLCTNLDVQSVPLIKLLLAHGIDANHPRERHLLHKHIYYNEIMELLLSHGMGKDVAEQWGWHVDLPFVPDAEEIVGTLVNRGVDIDAPMRGMDNDITLLEHLVQTNSQFLGFMATLMDKGASLSRINIDDLASTLKPIMDTHGDKISRVIRNKIEERTPGCLARTGTRRI